MGGSASSAAQPPALRSTFPGLHVLQERHRQAQGLDKVVARTCETSPAQAQDSRTPLRAAKRLGRGGVQHELCRE